MKIFVLLGLLLCCFVSFLPETQSATSEVEILVEYDAPQHFEALVLQVASEAKCDCPLVVPLRLYGVTPTQSQAWKAISASVNSGYKRITILEQRNKTTQFGIIDSNQSWRQTLFWRSEELVA